MDSPKILENLFYGITIVSTFTCIIRSDYNFAFGLLCYYMIKTSKDLIKAAKPVSYRPPIMILANTPLTDPISFINFPYVDALYQYWLDLV